MQPKIKTDQDKILSVLKKNEPLTYNEIAWRLGWFNPNKASRRMPELVRLGKALKKGVKRCSRAKSNCTAYILI
jgi:DNA-binding Lrp family transcriptional regulator